MELFGLAMNQTFNIRLKHLLDRRREKNTRLGINLYFKRVRNAHYKFIYVFAMYYCMEDAWEIVLMYM